MKKPKNPTPVLPGMFTEVEKPKKGKKAIPEPAPAPDVAVQARPQTHAEALESHRVHVSRLKAYDAICAAPDGLTPEEAASAAGISLEEGLVRIAELAEFNLVRFTGSREMSNGRMGLVWVRKPK